MPEDINEILYQLPVVLIILVVVWHFVKVVQRRDDNWLETTRNRDQQFLAELNKHQGESNKMQREVLEAFKGNSAVTARCIDVLEKVDKKLTREGFERDRERNSG